jgi:hypothetical protein
MGAVVVGGGGGSGAAALDVAGAGVSGGAIDLRGFTFAFALALAFTLAFTLTLAASLTVATVGVGAAALATTGKRAADAGAEALAIAEVLLDGVVCPAPAASPMMKHTATPSTAAPIFWSFFMAVLLRSSAVGMTAPPHEARKTSGDVDGQGKGGFLIPPLP